MLRTLMHCALGGALAVTSAGAWPASCFLSPAVAAAATPTVVLDGKESVTLAGVRAFDNCERLTVAKGSALAQYVDKQGKPQRELVVEGKGLTVANLDANPAPVRAVARGLLAVLTDPKERSSAGQKYFDKPSQVGAPFGDVYIPRDGLRVRFVNLEGDARVQIADAASNAVLLDALAAQGATLERSRFKPGGRYAVRVVSSRAKLPPGAFEVVGPDVSNDLDSVLQAIDADVLLDASTRPIARALAFEREGLSFNRELVLREMKP